MTTFALIASSTREPHKSWVYTFPTLAEASAKIDAIVGEQHAAYVMTDAKFIDGVMIFNYMSLHDNFYMTFSIQQGE